MSAQSGIGRGASRLDGRTAAHRRSVRLRIIALVVSDMACLVVAGLLAAYFRDQLPVFRPTLDIVENVGSVVVVFFLLWMAALILGGAYSTKRMDEGANEYTVVLQSSLVAAGGIAAFAYLANYSLSRGFFVLVFLIGIPLLILGRYGIRRLTRLVRTQGLLQTDLIVAGDMTHLSTLVQILQREKWLGYRIVGALPSDAPDCQTLGGIPVLGRPADAVSALERSGAQGVIFAAGSFAEPSMFNVMAREFEHCRAQMIVMPALTDISAQRIEVRPMAGIPLMFVERPRARQASSWSKRIFDATTSFILIVVLSPLLAAIALAIKLGDGGPVVFRQRRVGFQGKGFDCLKFRSMQVDAEARLSELESANEAAGVLFKVRDDPRITRAGRLLRRFSLDELPQLFNVLVGQMSLIGPRPALPREVAQYEDHVLRRLDVRPGMTGLWQVSGRSDLSWDETVRLDLYYVDNWSPLQDLNIIGRTLGAVLRRRGAY